MFLQEQITKLQTSMPAMPPVATNNGFTLALNRLQAVSLDELSKASLMDRTDTKFFFPAQALPELLELVGNHYGVLEMNGLRCIPYESLYFDTAGFDLYLQHHNGKGKRHKIRYRRYVNSNKTYFEIKLKTPQGRTIKNRTTVPGICVPLGQKAAHLLEQHTLLTPQDIEPVLWVWYYRITLMSLNFPERVTIDLGLHFINPLKQATWQNMCILEVKQNSANRHSVVVDTLKQLHIHPKSLSKYCIGVATTYPQLKHNQFKSKLLQIEKIEHLYAPTAFAGAAGN